MVDNKLNNSLINPLPPIILIITLILILIELIFQLSEASLMFGESGQILRNNIIMEYYGHEVMEIIDYFSKYLDSSTYTII